MASMQAHRQVEIITPLGQDVLLFRRMTVTEELGRLFRMELELLSSDPDIAFEKLLGENISVRLSLPDGRERYFNGCVSRFSQQGTFGDYIVYSATAHPWLWFLTRSADCRIFQNQTVPEIIKQVLRDHGYTDFDEALGNTYRQWEYCVQYRETDFNFVSRLMEQAGIYYFFKHQENKHTLVLADAVSAHEPAPGYEKVPYYPPDARAHRERDHIFDWHLVRNVQPGTYALNDYDFTKPNADLKTKSCIIRNHSKADLEIYDYPGEYVDANDGETYARARIEAFQADYEQVEAQANARGLAAGCLFELEGFQRSDQNREYLIVAADHHIESNAYASQTSTAAQLYTCRFTALDSQIPFRSARTTPKPIVQGPQTAKVVGKSGEEIWTDNYGRVKVQFHWDRYGKHDENSSCWVRVSHPTAGKGWGAVQIPRIGQEVIVDFLEGDPDQPIVTGRVYNANQIPPFKLPGGGMVSGMKSRSTPGGGGYNEISMNDTKGKEAITVHGQYDMNTTVNNDQNNTVGNNQSIDISANRTEKVGGDETITISGNRTETVTGSETVTISGGRTHCVSGMQTTTISVAEAHSVGAGRTHAVGAGETIEIGGAQAIEIGGAQLVEIGAAQNVDIGAIQAVSVGAKQSITVDGSRKVSAASISEKSDGPIKIKAGGTITVKAPTIVLKAGGSKITMNSGGITMKGAKIKEKASGNITINGGGGIKLKGPTIGEN